MFVSKCHPLYSHRQHKRSQTGVRHLQQAGQLDRRWFRCTRHTVTPQTDLCSDMQCTSFTVSRLGVGHRIESCYLAARTSAFVALWAQCCERISGSCKAVATIFNLVRTGFANLINGVLAPTVHARNATSRWPMLAAANAERSSLGHPPINWPRISRTCMQGLNGCNWA